MKRKTKIIIASIIAFFVTIFAGIAIFAYYERIWHAILVAIVLEFGLILFSWILLCNEVDHIRKVKNNDYSFQY